MITLCQKHYEGLIQHYFCPICGLYCNGRPFVRCAAKHRCHQHCLQGFIFLKIMNLSLNFSLGFDMSLCPHCGLELTESVQPKPQKIDEKISGMITLPSEHSSHFYYKPKDPVRMNYSSLTH